MKLVRLSACKTRGGDRSETKNMRSAKSNVTEMESRDTTILLLDVFSLAMVTARSPPSKLSHVKNEL